TDTRRPETRATTSVGLSARLCPAPGRRARPTDPTRPDGRTTRMRRTDGDTDSVGRARTRTGPAAALFLLLGLSTIAPRAARGDDPAPIDQVGQRVVARSGGLTLRDDRGAVKGVGGKGQVYRVERVDGRRLWLRAEGKDLRGWASVEEMTVAPPVD